MGLNWRYLKSFVSEEVVEKTSSSYNPVLEVWYVYGRKVLNSAQVNLSFGNLDTVFRSAFSQLKVSDRSIETVLVLGLGVGNVPAILRENKRPYQMVGVEIDSEVIRLGRNHFGLGDYGDMEVVNADALQYVFETESSFDLIVVDLFIDALVPEAAETETFLQRLGELLAPGGLLMFNRLMQSAPLRKQTEGFSRRMMTVLPGTKFLKAHKNRMLYYEKVSS